LKNKIIGFEIFIQPQNNRTKKNVGKLIFF